MPASTPVILLPPSEGKAPGGDGPAVGFDHGAFGALAVDRAAIRDATRRVLRHRAAAETLLGVRGAHLDRALTDWRALDSAPCMPAGLRYSGVVWGALSVGDMPPAVRRRMFARVVVPSGLWGLVAAGDVIPGYRLKMGARVAPIGLLSGFWRPRISPLLATRARRGIIIDLLPAEHAAAFDPAAFRPSAWVRVEIVDDGPGGRRSVGHAGKSLKGLLARAILQEDARTATDIAYLRVPGLSPGIRDQANGNNIVFIREG